MCIKCNKCGCSENQFKKYRYDLEEVKIQTKCPDCGYEEIYNYTKHPDCYIDECPSCESDNLDTHEWGYNEKTNEFIVYWHCEDCEEEFEIKYNLVD